MAVKSTDNAAQAGNPGKVLEKFIFFASSPTGGNSSGEKAKHSRQCRQALAILQQIKKWLVSGDRRDVDGIGH